MEPPICTPYTPANRYPEIVMRQVRYDGRELAIDFQGLGWSFGRVTFADPIGFRLLDERELTEFWERYSTQMGWLWVVERGGWLDLERQRPRFAVPRADPKLVEYMVIDIDKVVSVMCHTPPVIVDFGTDPQRSWPLAEQAPQPDSAPEGVESAEK